jgi:hypothetical protein
MKSKSHRITAVIVTALALVALIYGVTNFKKFEGNHLLRHAAAPRGTR